MRTVIKAGLTAVSALLLLAPASSASAPMSGDDTDGSVSLYVDGKGLHVDTITVMSDKQRNGERFRVYSHTGSAAGIVDETRWKTAKFHSYGLTKIAEASWKINRNFADGTWLCATAAKSDGNPCIKVHR
ncbi:hypothetical protein V2W30_01945 [Streptomyces sp. Q6]|uniref:Uncharacterized protein n=1 Tax=Streptomyces citrinus TaxID=3118173 RepID=A0ACD5A4Y5_9ACTN